MKSVMELLYELRVDHDLTQAEVGAVLGISQQHYSKYETGEYELPLRHFVSLANYYQVSADYLIGRHHNLELKEEDMVYLTAQYSCGNLLRDVMGLSAKGRQAVLEYVHLLQLKEQSKNADSVRMGGLFLCIHRNFGDWNTFPLENCREISKEDILHLF